MEQQQDGLVEMHRQPAHRKFPQPAKRKFPENMIKTAIYFEREPCVKCI